MNSQIEEKLSAGLRRTFFQGRPENYPSTETERTDFEDPLRGL
jgi:hypothetical protein